MVDNEADNGADVKQNKSCQVILCTESFSQNIPLGIIPRGRGMLHRLVTLDSTLWSKSK